ncbi:glycoside hydrolase family 88 protein [Galbibacter pacificus]|uniref:glycoside hydrolase family 88 protein n=1 Tax=Galbibacter pacificus TaxID=2996052 RepID=UPI002412767B|nr:glycoside hydrolase family 88 protein [Galbibacter pacificus]MDG3582331.1 glycoside hydrolase family 88 protein [Galbibacter pacificus]
MSTQIDKALQTAAEQYIYMANRLPDGRFPKTYHKTTDSLETSNSGWWCSGFYSGTLLYLYEAMGDAELKNEALKSLQALKKEQYNTSTHDLGFMMYCSFGNAERLEDSKAYETILMNSAKSLATRYNDTVKAIRSWDSAPWNKAEKGDLVVIIDNMMNLELLFWASKHSGDQKYANIAIAHANTTLENHFREDYSSYHEVIYSEATGKVKKRITNQGAADNSAWARGQAWGLYGYVVMYRETKNEKYLQQATNIAHFILNHPNFPKDGVPYWDFNAPNIPDALRDSSAAAIIGAALMELSTYTDGKYLAEAENILKTLLSPEYLAQKGTNGGFILKHGVGHMPANSEVDVPLTYGDYYLVEALLRYKKQQAAQ